MTRDQAIALIKARLKKTGTTDYDNAIVLEMQHIQESILEGGITLPWFLLSEFMSYTTKVNEDRIPLPVDPNDTSRIFLREYEEGALWKFDETTKKFKDPLTKNLLDDMLAKFNSTGQPKEYALAGPYFRVRPIPDAEYELKVLVYLSDTKLTQDIENRWLRYAGDWFINETIYIMASFYTRDQEAMAAARSGADAGKLKLFAIDEARKHANFDYQMGAD